MDNLQMRALHRTPMLIVEHDVLWLYIYTRCVYMY
jgi:hypothetical protein